MIEVGLGGRLDATNVVTPRISVITPIELEHTEFLGDTLEKIAAEKGGIIKERVPVIIAEQKPSVRKVFEEIARSKNAPIFFVDQIARNMHCFYSTDFGMNVEFESNLFKRKISAKLRLLGEFQAQNAVLAACAVKAVLPEISEEAIEAGLEKAFLPGRFEMTKNGNYPNIPLIILDGAHTVNSTRFTIQT